ncbi:hypothetical protein [Chryseobacterium turcicum]|uniref:Uncharacterized protein n=1 Tax=Chryseobacterium turcicum TaxID=2898076 RepID=A0A9Q3YYB8_9FLAO|nr:hypothetical protein [Chryseobacterium turcicum]MCD1118332.1 hypothetical protein [Chryseobacterium turcicum]
MKNLILPFILLLTLVFSCRENDIDERLERKTGSYDVYVGGTENLQVCYWKNNQKTILPGGDNLNGIQINVDNNNVYVLAVNIDSISNIPAWYFWKNGVKYDVAQYLNTLPNTSTNFDNIRLLSKMIVNNGDIYFAGLVKIINPTSGVNTYQLCYWKNGVKTIITNDPDEMMGDFEIFNNDIYISTRKNFNLSTLTWDLVHYKNGVQLTSTNTSHQIPKGYYKTSSGIFLLEKNTQNNIQSYKNVHTNTVTNLPTNITQGPINSIYWNENEHFYIGSDFYYKNNTLVQINDPNGFNRIGHLLTKDQNIYMTRIKDSAVKFYINNVETMMITDISKGCFNSICVVQN